MRKGNILKPWAHAPWNTRRRSLWHTEEKENLVHHMEKFFRPATVIRKDTPLSELVELLSPGSSCFSCYIRERKVGKGAPLSGLNYSSPLSDEWHICGHNSIRTTWHMIFKQLKMKPELKNSKVHGHSLATLLELVTSFGWGDINSYKPSVTQAQRWCAFAIQPTFSFFHFDKCSSCPVGNRIMGDAWSKPRLRPMAWSHVLPRSTESQLTLCSLLLQASEFRGTLSCSIIKK